MAEPTVSVMMSMRNAATTIRHSIESLLIQTFVDWELILLDDGSTDDSVARARSFCDPRIRVQESDRTIGLAGRLNQAIDLATGRYLARMDADDVAFPERFARQTAFLDSHPEVDLVGSAMVVFSKGGEATGLYPGIATHEEICSRPMAGFYLAHPTWMGRAGWFRRWRYDPACRKAQDQDLLLRAYRESEYAAIVEPLVGYRQEQVSVRKSWLGRFYFSRAIVKVALRDHGYLMVLPSLMVQIAKGVVDTIAVTTGLERQILRHRAQSLSVNDRERWNQVWNAVSELKTS